MKKIIVLGAVLFSVGFLNQADAGNSNKTPKFEYRCNIVKCKSSAQNMMNIIVKAKSAYDAKTLCQKELMKNADAHPGCIATNASKLGK